MPLDDPIAAPAAPNDTPRAGAALADAPADRGRRDFVARAALGGGFAAAAAPLQAQTVVQTDAQGLSVDEVVVPVGDFQLPVYRAMPAGRLGLPVVLVVSEVFGVHEHIADVCRRFAKAGYMALAPELFARHGDPAAYGEVAKLIAEVVSKVPDAQALGDLDACLLWARTHGGDVSRAGITGFCWGGRITWLYAAHNPRLRAGVAWYGRLTGATNALTPRHPVDVAPALAAPVLGLYGGQDTGIPLVDVERMKAALVGGTPQARASEFVVYPDAPHAFHADYRPTYREGPARDGWTRCLAWLRRHGVA